MKIPKQFLYFLMIFQTVLVGGHLLLYKSLAFLFPFFTVHKNATLVLLTIMSISFLSASILDYKMVRNSLTRWFYITSAVWMPVWLYLLLASGISLIFYLAAPAQLADKAAISFYGLAIAISLYGIINARYARIIKITAKLPNLPEFWIGKTAVLVSDLHLGHVLRPAFGEKIVKIINSLKPDIIFIAGDFFDGVHADFTSLAAPFKKAKAPLGIYFCSGNHELYAGMEDCEHELRKIGIITLDNQKIDVQGLQILGIAYEHERMPDLNEKLHNLNIDTSRPSILLKHVPLQISDVATAGISLQLAGHTHRGQVWPGSLITKRYYRGYDYGFKKYDNLLLYISSGVGTWGPPMRVFTKSEIVHITFTA